MSIIKKISSLVIIFICCRFPAPILAEQKDYALSLSPLLGIEYGQGEEIVYKYSGQNQFWSQLLWDLKPLFYAGVQADFAPGSLYERNGFTSALALKYGFPFKTGILENRDWDDIFHENLTHYSRHDAYSRSAFLADLSAGYSWRLTNSFACSAYGVFSYMYFSWSGIDGYYQYANSISIRQYESWDESIPKTFFNGEVINYSQSWFILSPGVSLKWKINSLFSLEGFFNYSPLIYCVDKDRHLLTRTTFRDYLYFGNHFKGGASLVYTTPKNWDVLFNFSYRYITGVRGDTEINRNSIKTYDYGNSGAGHSAMDMGIAVKIRLF